MTSTQLQYIESRKTWFIASTAQNKLFSRTAVFINVHNDCKTIGTPKLYYKKHGLYICVASCWQVWNILFSMCGKYNSFWEVVLAESQTKINRILEHEKRIKPSISIFTVGYRKFWFETCLILSFTKKLSLWSVCIKNAEKKRQERLLERSDLLLSLRKTNYSHTHWWFINVHKDYKIIGTPKLYYKNTAYTFVLRYVDMYRVISSE